MFSEMSRIMSMMGSAFDQPPSQPGDDHALVPSSGFLSQSQEEPE